MTEFGKNLRSSRVFFKECEKISETHGVLFLEEFENITGATSVSFWRNFKESWKPLVSFFGNMKNYHKPYYFGRKLKSRGNSWSWALELFKRTLEPSKVLLNNLDEYRVSLVFHFWKNFKKSWELPGLLILTVWKNLEDSWCSNLERVSKHFRIP